MLRNIPLILLVSASLVACGGSDNKKKNNSSSSVPSSVAASSTPASSTPASSTPASSTPASSTPASSTPASSMPASSSSSSVAAGKLDVDFESDETGTLYEYTSWSPDQLIATVVTIESVTGLAANGSSTKVLKILPADYNALPLVEIEVPAGKTLADYTVKVDAYFPRSTLGLSESNANFYKDFMLLAGTSITSGANDTNPAYLTKIETIWDDVDVWKTYTFPVDAVKGAALTGVLKIGLGLNRPAGTNDAYYFDNIRLEAK